MRRIRLDIKSEKRGRRTLRRREDVAVDHYFVHAGPLAEGSERERDRGALRRAPGRKREKENGGGGMSRRAVFPRLEPHGLLEPRHIARSVCGSRKGYTLLSALPVRVSRVSRVSPSRRPVCACARARLIPTPMRRTLKSHARVTSRPGCFLSLSLPRYLFGYIGRKRPREPSAALAREPAAVAKNCRLAGAARDF